MQVTHTNNIVDTHIMCTSALHFADVAELSYSRCFDVASQIRMSSRNTTYDNETVLQNVCAVLLGLSAQPYRLAAGQWENHQSLSLSSYETFKYSYLLMDHCVCR